MTRYTLQSANELANRYGYEVYEIKNKYYLAQDNGIAKMGAFSTVRELCLDMMSVIRQGSLLDGQSCESGYDPEQPGKLRVSTEYFNGLEIRIYRNFQLPVMFLAYVKDINFSSGWGDSPSYVLEQAENAIARLEDEDEEETLISSDVFNGVYLETHKQMGDGGWGYEVRVLSLDFASGWHCYESTALALAEDKIVEHVEEPFSTTYYRTGTMYRGSLSEKFTDLEDAYKNLYTYKAEEMYDKDDSAILVEINGKEVVFDTFQPHHENGNTIIAANRPIESGINPDVSGTFTSEGYNLIGDGTGSTGFDATGDIVGTSDNPIDPRLAPLDFNGGPTQTIALLPDSPAIDAGDPTVLDTDTTTDQRGLPRRAADGSADIGAFEFST